MKTFRGSDKIVVDVKEKNGKQNIKRRWNRLVRNLVAAKNELD